MDSPTAIRHVVNLAGVVQEAEDPAATNANHLQSPPKPQRLAGALVRILAATAPPAFQDRLLRRLDDLYADSFVCPIDADVGQLDQAGAPRHFCTDTLQQMAGTFPQAQRCMCWNPATPGK
ncbi:MAG: hypothetical protein R2856_02155 [Caldilineaceae bacterium]